MFPPQTDEQPETYLESIGTIFARFGADTQDSGNISYGVAAGDQRYFFKTAGIPSDTAPYFDFEGRQQLLRTAARLAESVVHPALPTFHGVIESPGGPVLSYEWRDGEHLRAVRDHREDPTTAYQRFRALPTDELLTALDQVFDLHAGLTAAGWVEGDFYDGSLIYDFARRRLTVMDLDSYRFGPYRNDMGRMFGSSRFMAPEQFSLGAPIDDRTTAFVMARTGLVFLSDGTLNRSSCRATDAQYAVLQEAVTTRYPSYTAFYDAWREAS
ncbi:serine/threonine protein kinase [Kribbella voronezhensis]|uniref:Serine/threonine protein kinase n=1 Tax=Kribbella voronezhensis TaxID=2512212 RepID=A0A4R7T4L3_9ACTN|nr:serine/threonine protein kinase [Kribbella voronezhensis]TDU86761.1 serine/threonine protein kinase [Kribbella voronezhensis]